MKLAYRILPPQYETDEQFARLVTLLKGHRPAVDEISLFTEYWHHSYFPLDRFAARANLLGRRIEQLRREAFACVGINMLDTMGHLNEAWDFLPAMPFPPMVGHDGKLSRCTACPNSPESRQYIREKYRLIAQVHPDFIWVDDDIRMHHHSVDFGCFCPVCIAKLGHGPQERQSFVAALNAPAGGDLRRAWIEQNAQTLEDLLREIGDVIRQVDPRIDVGLMTGGPGWTTYSGQAIDRWMKALGGRRLRPGGGFYDDSSPRAMIGKALEIGRQVQSTPASVDNIQYELEDFPYHKLDKSVRTVLNECLLSLATGCNGVAFNMLKDLPGSLDDYADLFTAIEHHRPLWGAFLIAADGLPLRGLWPAFDDSLMARRQVRGVNWFTRDADYAIGEADALANIGLPLTLDKHHACGALLIGRIAEIFTDQELRRLLAGGVLMDVSALHVLWERGLGDLTGVRPGKSFDNGVWERFTDHPLNAPYAGDGRDCRLSFWSTHGWQLLPLHDSIGDLAHLIGYDGSDQGTCLSTFTNDLGGRVAVLGYSPWNRLGNSAKRSQMLSLADWISGGKLPILIPRTVRVTPLVRQSADGKRLAAVLLNTSFDPTGPLELIIRAPLSRVRLLTPRGETALAVKPQPDGICVALPDLLHWNVAVLAGDAPMA